MFPHNCAFCLTLFVYQILLPLFCLWSFPHSVCDCSSQYVLLYLLHQIRQVLLYLFQMRSYCLYLDHVVFTHKLFCSFCSRTLMTFFISSVYIIAKFLIPINIGPAELRAEHEITVLRLVIPGPSSDVRGFLLPGLVGLPL